MNATTVTSTIPAITARVANRTVRAARPVTDRGHSGSHRCSCPYFPVIRQQGARRAATVIVITAPAYRNGGVTA